MERCDVDIWDLFCLLAAMLTWVVHHRVLVALLIGAVTLAISWLILRKRPSGSWISTGLSMAMYGGWLLALDKIYHWWTAPGGPPLWGATKQALTRDYTAWWVWFGVVAILPTWAILLLIYRRLKQISDDLRG